MQYDSVRKGKDKITLEEINNEIKDVRSKRILKLYWATRKNLARYLYFLCSSWVI